MNLSTLCFSSPWLIRFPSWLSFTTKCLRIGVRRILRRYHPLCLSFYLRTLTFRMVLAIVIVCCYCLLFFYFWYSSYRNGFKMSCCFYTKIDFWKSINKPKWVSSVFVLMIERAAAIIQITTVQRTRSAVVSTTASSSRTQRKPSPIAPLSASSTWKSTQTRFSPCWDRFLRYIRLI